MKTNDFNPPLTLRSAHLQTLLGSRLVHRPSDHSKLNLQPDYVKIRMKELTDSPTLSALVNQPATCTRGLIIIIHGWLGGPYSPYVQRVTGALLNHGFTVARLVLRDHGGSEGANKNLFNSAKLDEVVGAVNWLQDNHATRKTGLLGFSLGGNFALRVAAKNTNNLQSCLSVCPAIEPAETIRQIDTGLPFYRRYFISKWRKSLMAKQTAFPDFYNFDQGLKLSTVSALTDYLVGRHLPFKDSQDYYAHYQITDSVLESIKIPTTILASADDPVCPISCLRTLQSQEKISIVETHTGGHCGFLRDWHLKTWIEDAIPQYFENALMV